MKIYNLYFCLLLALLSSFALPGGKYPLTREDQSHLAFYREHFARNFTGEEKEGAIPKQFHIIWLGPDDFPQDSLKNIERWRMLHPHWEFFFWSDRERSGLPSELVWQNTQYFPFELLRSQFDLSDNYGEKSEILRYEILFQKGGIYLDHDLFPLRSLDDLHAHCDFFAGLEVVGPSILSSSIFPSTHIIAAKPGHPILLETMHWLQANWEEVGALFPGEESSCIYNRVKHRSFSAFQEGVKLLGKTPFRDLLFPQEYFSESDKNRALYAIHQHAGTWHRLHREQEEKIEARILAISSKLSGSYQLLLIMISVQLGGVLLFLGVKHKRRLGALTLLLSCCLSGCKEEERSTEFEQLMGKKTEHWKYLTEKEDQLAFDQFEVLYEKNKRYLREPLGLHKIPKVVHFIWLGPKPFPPESVENVRTWIAMHPDWEFKLWTDRKRALPCSTMKLSYVEDFLFGDLKSCYEQSQNYGEKSDILRYEILYQEGGAYADHDANCLSSFENLHESYDLYCGLEAPHPQFAGRNITSGNGVVGARAGHPVIKEVLREIGRNWHVEAERIKGQDAESKMQLVLQRTYIALTRALLSEADREENVDIVLPSAYFFAKTGIPSLYSKHFYATAWAKNKGEGGLMMEGLEKRLAKLQKETNKVRNLACITCFLTGAIGFWLLRRSRF